MQHIPDDGRQHAALTCSHVSYDAHELPLWDFQVHALQLNVLLGVVHVSLRLQALSVLITLLLLLDIAIEAPVEVGLMSEFNCVFTHIGVGVVPDHSGVDFIALQKLLNPPHRHNELHKVVEEERQESERPLDQLEQVNEQKTVLQVNQMAESNVGSESNGDGKPREHPRVGHVHAEDETAPPEVLQLFFSAFLDHLQEGLSPRV